MSSHPFDAPTVSGTKITIDTYLKQPTRITKMLMDLTQEKFISDQIFSSAGGVTGGAVIYDEITSNDLYLNKDVPEVAASGEFPRLQGSALAPKVANVHLYGGEIEISDRARIRNDQRAFARDVTRLSNTIVKKINQVAVDVLEASLVAHPAQATTVSALSLDGWDTIAAKSGIKTGWSADAPDPSGSSDPVVGLYTFAQRPEALFSAVQLQADTQELGVVYDRLIVNPMQANALRTIYGRDLNAVLADNGLTLVKSNRVANGTAYFAAFQQVGGMALEEPLKTKTYREDRHQRDVVQSWVVPAFYVDNPTAVVKVTGLNA